MVMEIFKGTNVQIFAAYDFPTEILLHICDDSDDSVLYRLCFVSRHFHNICVNRLLGRYGINDPTTRSVAVLHSINDDEQTSNSIDALSVLRVALFVSEIQELSCTFPKQGSDVDTVIYHLDRLQSLISRLMKVQKLTVNFDKQLYCSEIAGSLRRWSQSLGNVLNTSLERGCTDLNVRGARNMVDTFTCHTLLPTKSSKITQTSPALQAKVEPKSLQTTKVQVVHGDGWRFCPISGDPDDIHPTILSSLAQKLTVLHSIEISSTSLFLPPVLHWTISALHASPIEELTISDISLVDYDLWSIIFTLIAEATPQLQKLTLRDLTRIMPEFLFNFCGRFSSLKSLTIGEDVEYIDKWYSGPLPELLDLTSLTAPSIWVEKLLTRSGLPQLQNLSMSFHLHDEGYPMWRKYSSVNTVLNALDKRKLRVDLKVVLERDLEAWLKEEIFYSYKLTKLQRIVGLSIIIHSAFSQKNNTQLETKAMLIPEWLKQFHSIQHLSIINKCSIISAKDFSPSSNTLKCWRSFPILRISRWMEKISTKFIIWDCVRLPRHPSQHDIVSIHASGFFVLVRLFWHSDTKPPRLFVLGK